MAKIIIEVPDGDTCKGCNYKYSEHNEFITYILCTKCRVFDCTIYGDKKCSMCKDISINLQKERGDNLL